MDVGLAAGGVRLPVSIPSSPAATPESVAAASGPLRELLACGTEETSLNDLWRGDLGEVRSAGEILATLDAQGEMAGLPFMPEMAAHCGRRFRVDRRADRICDTVHY